MSSFSASAFFRFLFAFITGSFSLLSAQERLIEEINFLGNKQLKSSFILQIMKTKVGQELDSITLQGDLQKINEMHAVSYASYIVKKKGSGRIGLNISIKENFTLIPYANFFTANNGEFAYRIGLNELNLFGKNIALGGFYQRDVFDSYSVYMSAPFLFSKNAGMSMSLTNLKTQEPVFFDDKSANYKYNNRSLEMIALYRLHPLHRLSLGLNVFNEKYRYLAGEKDNDIPLSFNINKWLIKGSYQYNKLRYEYEFVKGFKSEFHWQMVGTFNEDPLFYIGWNDFVYYKRLGDTGNWATRLRIGLSTNKKTPFAPFALDNNINIRGVGNVIDRGTGTLVLNTEYRHSFYNNDWLTIQANAFIDAGSWRKPGTSLHSFSKKENLRIHPGIGFRFIHKKLYNTVFRIDYGQAISSNKNKGFVFGIGQYF